MKVSTLAKWTASILLATVISGCDKDDEKTAQADATPIKMWVAPNENEEAFWNAMVTEWNNSPRHRKVEFTTIPAASSSEEAIMNALASGTEPDISSNVFIGFASQLNEMDQLVDLAKLPNYSQLIENRNMGKIVPAWEIKGQTNVLPIYINPIVYWWRMDLLKKYGYEKVPTTYQDIYTLSQRRADDKSGYAVQLTAGKNWWDRWFDFIPLYYAQTNGQAYIADNKAQYNSSQGETVLAFMTKIFANKWSSYDFTAADDPLATGQVMASVRGPWDIARYRKQYPAILETIQIGPMVTVDGHPQPHTLADSKGVVMFKSSKHQTEAWEFIQWVFSNPEHDLKWLELTGMPPARGDLLTNNLFTAYLDRSPVEKQIAAHVANAQPPAATTKTTEIQRSMTQMIERTIFSGTTPVDALNQSAAETDKLLGQ